MVSISKQCYKTKPTSSDYSKMRFQKEELTLDDFSDKISQGYSFCHIFKEDKRKNENFLYTNFVCVDVDDSVVSLFDFLCTIEAQPTIAYTTYSNGIDNLYAYRLLYFFDKEIIKEVYPVLYDSICTSIGLENTKDNCGRILAQLMNGNAKVNIELIKSDKIYSLSRFINDFNLSKVSLEYNSSHPSHINSNGTFDNNIRTKNREKVLRCLNENVENFI